jgi:hypothetical protein
MSTYSFSTSPNFDINSNISTINANIASQITSHARTNTVAIGNSLNITFASALSAENANVLANIINTLDPGPSADNSAYFGRYYQYAAQEAEVSTTSTTYVTKLQLSTDVIPAGNYRIGYYYEYRSTTAGKYIGVQVIIDNSTVIHTLYQNPTDNLATNSFPISGFAVVPLTNAIHQININLLSSDGKSTQYLKRTHLEAYRIS